MTTVSDISITLHKRRATIVGNTTLGKFWLYSNYGDAVIRIEELVALQLAKKYIEGDVREMVEDGLKVVVHESA